MNALTVLIQPNVGQNKITLFLFSFLILFMYKLFPGAVILLWIGFSLVGLIQELYLKSSRSETPVLSNKNQEHNNTTDSGVNNLN
jgi:membrane protein insertase Oxa1/YidC/SpoIIIJ